jgi:hypothetical protein
VQRREGDDLRFAIPNNAKDLAANRELPSPPDPSSRAQQ